MTESAATFSREEFVICEQPGLLVLNKPADLRLDNSEGDTVNRRVLTLYPELAKFWLVHQLDLATSGLSVLSRSLHCLECF
jgi:23S rRNA-/tRNA-specific pseudouridylate synthase